jgi:steroid delta-isomerase-like uncharacterized protein
MNTNALSTDSTVSRRLMLGAAGLGGIGALAIATAPFAGNVMAQEATPLAGTHPVVEELIAAFSAGDIDGAMALYHDDAVFQEFPSHPEPVTGVNLIRQAFAEAAAPFSEIELQAVNVVVEGNRVATETNQKARYANQIPGLPEVTGQPVEFRFVSFLELEDGRIKRDTTYTDLYTLLVQIGALPGGEAA